MIVDLDKGITVEVEIIDVYRDNKTMIIDKKEKTELVNLLKEIQDFLKSVRMENTNVGMDIGQKINKWLVKLGK